MYKFLAKRRFLENNFNILTPGGLAEKCGKLSIGDELLSINGESVLNKPLSEAIKLLQQSGPRVQLQLARKLAGTLLPLAVTYH